jgi:hydrogenase maturation protein HypF
MQAAIEWDEDLPPVVHARQLPTTAGDPLDLLRRQITGTVNAPLTSSMGRLFDAVSSLLGVRQTANYEAQAAIELESLADQDESGAYPFAIEGQLLDPAPMFQSLLSDLRAGVPLATLSGRFHNTLADLLHRVCQKVRTETGIAEVAMSGGVWQNMTLLEKSIHLLDRDGFTIYLHHQVPANDGGISLGQAVIAMHKLDL